MYSLFLVLRVSIYYAYDTFHQTNRYVSVMYECTSKLGRTCIKCSFASDCDSAHLNFISYICKLNNVATL